MLLSTPALPLVLLATPPPQASELALSWPTLTLALEVPGAEPQDALYIIGVISVFAFAVKNVFDSAFPENTNEFVPPMVGAPTLPGPLKDLIGGGAGADPAEEAERLRLQLQAAAEAGDLKTAFQLEKDLKNLMAESGMRFIVDDEYQQSEDAEQLPDKW